MPDRVTLENSRLIKKIYETGAAVSLFIDKYFPDYAQPLEVERIFLVSWRRQDCNSLTPILYFRGRALKEAIQNLAAVMIERRTVTDQEMDAMIIRDQQCR